MNINSDLNTKLIEDKEVILNIKVNINEFNIIMSSLQELPHRIVDPILRKLIEQANSQIKERK